jgi:hypothetical protein
MGVVPSFRNKKMCEIYFEIKSWKKKGKKKNRKERKDGSLPDQWGREWKDSI